MRRTTSLILCVLVVAGGACSSRSKLPSAISDQEFSQLIEILSEAGGTFTISENFVSNEPHFAENIRRLGPTGGVYIGVGPEQNFSYIAGLRPALAFIIDIRRENRNLHLWYKALFEASSDRADFVSRLFSRPRPSDLGSDATVEEIFRRYDAVRPSPEQHLANAALVRKRLITRGLNLSPLDLEWIDRLFKAFYDDGPGIQFWGSRIVDRDAVRPSYRQLMTARDGFGQSRSFLASEDAFRFVKELHSRNLIVPVVGDFGGPSALQGVGRYVRDRFGVVQAFYGSNVGVYLSREQAQAFCRNLATLPISSRAWFIESDRIRLLSARVKACAPAGT